MNRTKFLIFPVLMSMFIITPLFSENYYIDNRSPAASDDNPGVALDLPWKTISQSFSIVQPGDTVFIANGIYRERLTFGNAHGTKEAPLVFKALGDSVLVSGATEIDNSQFFKLDGYQNVYATKFWPRIGEGANRHQGVIETNHATWDKQYERVTDPDNYSDWYFEHCPYYNWELGIDNVENHEGTYFQYDSLVYIHSYRHLDPRTANLDVEFVQDQGYLVSFASNNIFIILDGIDFHYTTSDAIVNNLYAEGVQVKNSWILGGRISLLGPQNVIENCTIENVIIKGSDRQWDHKPALGYSAINIGGAGSIAKNNVIKNNWNGGQPSSGAPGEPCIWDGNVNKNAPNHLSCHPINRGDHDIIYRNSVFFNAQDGIYFDSVHDIIVENCILIWLFAQYYDGSYYGSSLKSDSSYNITLRNNIFLCDGYTIQNGCLEGFDSDYNLFLLKNSMQFKVGIGETSHRSLNSLQSAGYDEHSLVVVNQDIFANVPVLLDYCTLEIADRLRNDFAPIEGAPQLNAGDPAYGTDYPGGRINIGPADLQPDSYSNIFQEKYHDSSEPTKLTLKQNYPNPFNDSTNLVYGLSQDAHVKIDIFNMRGQHIQKLVDKYEKAGEKIIQWTPNSLGSGLYLCRFSEGNNAQFFKMLLMK